MADDAEAQEIHATITSVGPREEPMDDDEAEASGVVGEHEDDPEDEDEDVTGDDRSDPDAVLVGHTTPAHAGLDEDDEDAEDDDDEREPFAVAPADETDESDDNSEDDDTEDTDSPMTPADAFGTSLADDDTDDDTHPDTVPAHAVSAGDTPDDVTPAEVTVPDPEPASATAVPAGDTVVDPGAPVTPAAAAATTPVTAPGTTAGEGFPRHARPGTVTGAAAPGLPSDTEPSDGGELVGDADQLHEQWAAIQSTFVDDPRGSVQAAAELVGQTIESLLNAVKEQENGLRSEWDHDEVDTEVLRNTLRNYRSLLDRLVAV